MTTQPQESSASPQAPERPDANLKSALWCLVAAVAAALIAQGLTLQYVCFAALLLPATAVVLFIAARRLSRAADGAVTSSLQPTLRHVRVWLILLGLAALAVDALLFVDGRRDWLFVEVRAVTQSNLKGIGQALEEYCRDYQDYPARLDVLMDEGLATQHQLISPFDYVHESERSAAAGYSSYAYIPGTGPWRAEPEVILAYERIASESTASTSWRGPTRPVLFGDAETRILTDDNFAQALLRDRERRKELGWPLGF